MVANYFPWLQSSPSKNRPNPPGCGGGSARRCGCRPCALSSCKSGSRVTSRSESRGDGYDDDPQ